MLDTRLTQVFSHPSLMAMANRGFPNQMPILKDNHCWLPHLQRGGPMGPGSAVFPIQPLRPLAFMATGSHPHIPQTISPVNHQHLNDLINNREGSPTPTEGMNFKCLHILSNRKKNKFQSKKKTGPAVMPACYCLSSQIKSHYSTVGTYNIYHLPISIPWVNVRRFVSVAIALISSTSKGKLVIQLLATNYY